MPCETPRELDRALQRASRSHQDYIDKRTLVANIVIGMMLPGGVVKGGTALKIRYGSVDARYTADIDVARPENLEEDDYFEMLRDCLEKGWQGFSGKIFRQPITYYPRNVETAYLARQYTIALSYHRKRWLEVNLEVGHNEAHDADECERIISKDICNLFTSLGLHVPSPVPLMLLDYQVAQKLHAVSAPRSPRAHDLVDLQLIAANSQLDLHKVRQTCLRVFAYRQMQPWPPVIEVGERWDEAYAEAARDCEVLPGVQEAVAWANDFVGRIDAAR